MVLEPFLNCRLVLLMEDEPQLCANRQDPNGDCGIAAVRCFGFLSENVPLLLLSLPGTVLHILCLKQFMEAFEAFGWIDRK